MQESWQKVVQRRPGKESIIERDVEMDSSCGAAVDVWQVMSRMEWDRVVVSSPMPPNG